MNKAPSVANRAGPLYRKAVRPASPLFALAALLAACAAPLPPASLAPPLSYPPAARQRMLAIAEAEWRDWGAIEVIGWARLPPGRESAPANFPRVLAYWASVPEGPAVIAGQRQAYAATLAGAAAAALWSEPPWSAAFVSHVLRAAGVDAAEFPPTAAHATYIDALVAQALAFPDRAPFVPHAPSARAASPGDLLCADRSARPLADWMARLAEAGRFRPMHCNIVVAAPTGAVLAIGGNVGDAVVRRRFPADAAGIVQPAPAGEPPFVLLLENRLGRLPPWDVASQAEFTMTEP